MAVYLQVLNKKYEIGHWTFFKSFFDTIHFHLEKGSWGSRYPHILIDLYKGRLNYEFVDEVIKNLTEIEEIFKSIPPSSVIWDINNSKKSPPWGDNISSRITSLANYYVTSDGKDLFKVLFTALQESRDAQVDLVIS